MIDFRKLGYLAVGVLIPKVTLANPMANAEEILRLLLEAYEQGIQYAISPELSLTGYSCGDYFHQGQMANKVLEALAWLLNQAKHLNMMFSVGAPLYYDGGLYNCAVVIKNGVIKAVYVKSYPPNYREFYERQFSRWPANRPPEQMVLLGQTTWIGTKILIESDAYAPGLAVFHEVVCEDDWPPISTGDEACLAGATVQGNHSASNITVGKSKYRHDLFRVLSGRRNGAVLYSAASTDGESTTDMAWDGDGFICEIGTELVAAKRFRRGGFLIKTVVDLFKIRSERVKQTSFQQCADDRITKSEWVRVVAEGPLGNDEKPSVYRHLFREIDPYPFIPSDPLDLDERCWEVFQIQVSGLRRRIESLPDRYRDLYLGVSGGWDSTHVALVAAHTLDEMGLPRSRLHFITMPGPGTSERTHKNAIRLIEALGATKMEIPIFSLATHLLYLGGHQLTLDPDEAKLVIQNMVERLQNLLDKLERGQIALTGDTTEEVAKNFLAILYDDDLLANVGTDNPDVAYENGCAWPRMMILFINSAVKGGIVLGTGDLTEALLGFMTMYADHASHYNVNGDNPKTLEGFLIRWAAEKIYGDDEELQAALVDVAGTPISPELLRAKNGQIAQLTEKILGPLELHDFFGYHMIRFSNTPLRTAYLASEAFGDKYTLPEIKRTLEIFVKRFFGGLDSQGNQFKRDTVPGSPKIGLLALSPRGDWRAPADAFGTIWYQDVLEIPDSWDD